MRYHYISTRRCKQAGRLYQVLGIRKWGKLYYSCSGNFETQATSVTEAKRQAIAAGTMAWLDEVKAKPCRPLRAKEGAGTPTLPSSKIQAAP